MYMYMHTGQRVYKSNELPILYIIMYNLLFPLISLLFSPLPSSLSLSTLCAPLPPLLFCPLLSSSVLFCPLLSSPLLASLFSSSPLLSSPFLSFPLLSALSLLSLSRFLLVFIPSLPRSLPLYSLCLSFSIGSSLVIARQPPRRDAEIITNLILFAGH